MSTEKANADQDRLDAARYRWLRDYSCALHNFYISVPVEFTQVRYSSAQVDAAIDEAIAAIQQAQRLGTFDTDPPPPPA